MSLHGSDVCLCFFISRFPGQLSHVFLLWWEPAIKSTLILHFLTISSQSAKQVGGRWRGWWQRVSWGGKWGGWGSRWRSCSCIHHTDLRERQACQSNNWPWPRRGWGGWRQRNRQLKQELKLQRRRVSTREVRSWRERNKSELREELSTLLNLFSSAKLAWTHSTECWPTEESRSGREKSQRCREYHYWPHQADHWC